MRQKSHRIFLTEPVLNCRGKVQKSVFLDDGEFAILRSRAALLGTSARALMTRDMQESRKLLDSKTEEALKGALRQVEERSRL
ncbi:MAG: hypothetical protein IIZ04_02140 [Aeriscardovia sp.]|nr:hypothetical protein [Aeriscardovia sp.]